MIMENSQNHREITSHLKGIDFADYLSITLSDRINKNAQYSLRSFARDLDVSPGNLSDLIGKKRKFSVKMVKKICTNLALSPVISQQFLTDLVASDTLKNDKEKSSHYDQQLLSEDQFKIICEWQHFAILRLINTKDFKPSLPWIARRLGTKSLIVRDCRDRLLRAGLLEIKDGIWIDQSEGKTSYLKSDKSDQYIKRFLKTMQLLSSESIDRDPITDRNHTGMMVSLPKKSLPQAIELIKNFRRSFAELVEQNKEENDEVYYLDIGLFPITK